MKYLKRPLSILKIIRFYGICEMVKIGWYKYWGKTRLILFALSEPRPIPKAVDAAKNHTFKFATVDDLTELKKDPETDIKQDDIEHIKKGVRCLLQMDGDVLVGFTWVWCNQLAHTTDGVHINLPDDTKYSYKSYTAPAYRGFGFQALRHLQLLHYLEVEGVMRLFAYVDHFNTKSLHGIRKSGFVKVGELKINHKKGVASLDLAVDEKFWPGVVRL